VHQKIAANEKKRVAHSYATVTGIAVLELLHMVNTGA